MAGCGKCNGNGFGYASAMFADDVGEERITMVNPVYAKLPAEPAPAVNATAAIVTASLAAQAPTSGFVDGQPAPMVALVDDDEPAMPPAKSGGLGKVVVAGLGLFLAWKVFG